MGEDPKKFNIWKDMVEDVNPIHQIDCLRAVEVNLSNVCNLRCPFCPQSQGWTTDSPKYMSVETAKEIANQLKSFNFHGYLCIAGWGEPSLNPNFEEIINLFKDFQPQVITNGKTLDEETWHRICDISQVKISVHDWDNLEYYKEKFKNTNAWFRNHDAKNPQMNLYNRAGYMSEPEEKIYRQCYLMFYKVCIDTDGTYYQCEADWARKSKTPMTIFNTPIYNYFSTIINYRRRLMLLEGGRQNFECCKTCDINGLMVGEKFVEFWKEKNTNGK